MFGIDAPALTRGQVGNSGVITRLAALPWPTEIIAADRSLHHALRTPKRVATHPVSQRALRPANPQSPEFRVRAN